MLAPIVVLMFGVAVMMATVDGAVGCPLLVNVTVMFRHAGAVAAEKVGLLAKPSRLNLELDFIKREFRVDHVVIQTKLVR